MKAYCFRSKLHVFIVLCSGLIWMQSQPSIAQTIDVMQAMEKAKALPVPENVGPHKAASRQSAPADPTLAYTSTTNGRPHYYVFNYPDGGFAIIGGDATAREVLGYCPEGTFDIEKIPDGLRDMLSMYDDQISHAIETDNTPNDTTAPSHAAASRRASIPHLIKTTWGQTYPYNAALPTIGDNSSRLLTGCVATAFAQYMNYFKYPTTGEGKESYNKIFNAGFLNFTNITFSADFGNTVYDWHNMLDSYNSGYSDAQVKAVGTLMYHVGVAAHMDYGIDESLADVNDAGFALTKYFGYDPNAQVYTREKMTDSEWEDVIYDVLKNNQPVLYSSRSQTGGHAYLCDGYDATLDFYHFNWGWNGYCDGYYPLSGQYAFKANGAGMASPDEAVVYDCPLTQKIIIGLTPMGYVSADVKVRSINVNPTKIEIPGGSHVQLTAEVLPEYAYDKTVSWSSGNENIATVSEDGMVTAVAEGKVTITCSANDGSGKSASCSITVCDRQSSVVGTNDVSLSRAPFANSTKYSTTLSLYSNEEIGLSGNITSLSYYVSNPSPTEMTGIEIYLGLTSLDHLPNHGSIKPDKLTKVYESSHQSIGTQNGWEEYQFSTPFEYNGKDNLVVVVTKKTDNYNPVLSYAQATTRNTECINKWSTTNVSYGDISDISNNSHPYNQLSSRPVTKFSFYQRKKIPVSSIAFSSQKLSIQKGESQTLNVDILPTDATDPTIVWQSSDPNVAFISADGTLNAQKEGIITITATIKGHNELKTSCEVTVTSDSHSSSGDLRQLEYWFDSNVGQRHYVSLSGSIEYLDLDIPTTGLTEGIHWLQMRTQNSDGDYSGITSSLFLKANEEKGNQIEYWFDNDYAKRGSMTLKASNTTAGSYQAILDLSDIQQFPIGLHMLNYRISTAGGLFGSVASAMVMRVGIGQASALEYWVDEDLANSHTVEGTRNADGDIEINTSIDLSNVAPGFHRLYYRASSKDNTQVGAVSMTPIMVLGGDGNTVFEYWLDEDHEHSKKVELSGSNNLIDIDQDIDLSDASAGFHRLHYRLSSPNDLTVSAVSMTPIMVKSIYNPETSDDLVVTQYRFWVDDSNQKTYRTLTNPRHEIDIIHDLNPSAYLDQLPKSAQQRGEATLASTQTEADGYTLNFQAGNSAGVWSEVEHMKFVGTKEVGKPQILLGGKADGNGHVSLFTDIKRCDLERIIIFRKTENSSYSDATIVFDKTYSSSNRVWNETIVDTPPPGKYYYIAGARYSEWNGEINTVLSEDLPIEVAVAAPEPTTSALTGILCQRQGADDVPASYVKVIYTDQDIRQEVITDQNGRFAFDGLLIGSHGTITVESELFYLAEPFSVEVKKANPNYKMHVMRYPELREVDQTNVPIYLTRFTYQDNEIKLSIANNGLGKFSGKIAIGIVPSIAGQTYSSTDFQKRIGEQKLELNSFSSIEEISIPLNGIQIDGITGSEVKCRIYAICSTADIAWEPIPVNTRYRFANPFVTLLTLQAAPLKWDKSKTQATVDEIIKIVKNAHRIEHVIGYHSVISDIGWYESGNIEFFKKELTYAIEQLSYEADPVQDVRNFYAALNSYLLPYAEKTGSAFEYLYWLYDTAWQYVQKNPGNFFAQFIKDYLDIDDAIAQGAYSLGILERNLFDQNFIKMLFSSYSKFGELKFFSKNNGQPITPREGNDVIKTIEVMVLNADNPEKKIEQTIEVDTKVSGNAITMVRKSNDTQKLSASQHVYILHIKWKNGRESYIPLINKPNSGISIQEFYSVGRSESMATITFEVIGTEWDKSIANNKIIVKKAP